MPTPLKLQSYRQLISVGIRTPQVPAAGQWPGHTGGSTQFRPGGNGNWKTMKKYCSVQKISGIVEKTPVKDNSQARFFPIFCPIQYMSFSGYDTVSYTHLTLP